jgi:uncharacterized membrane protein
VGADLRVMFRGTSRLLGVFCLGSVATAVGATVAFGLLSGAMALVGVGDDGWKVAAGRGYWEL